MTTQEWDLVIKTGFYGGAPPNRTFRESNSWNIKVHSTDSVSDLLNKIKQVSNRPDLNVKQLSHEGNGSWEPSGQADQTLEQSGLKSGSILKFHNGLMD